MHGNTTALAEMGAWYTPWTWAKEFAEGDAIQAKLDAQNRKVYTVTPIDLTKYKAPQLVPYPAEKALAEREASLARIAAELAERERRINPPQPVVVTPDVIPDGRRSPVISTTALLVGLGLVAWIGYAAFAAQKEQ